MDAKSGLEWLDVTKSVGRSYDDVSSQFGIGGDFEGWRYAIGLEFNQLVSNYTGETITLLNGVVNQEVDKIDGLVDLLGSTLDVYYLETYGDTYDAYHGYEQGLGLGVVTGILADVLPYTEPAHYAAELYDDDRYGRPSYYDLSYALFIRTIDSEVRNATGSFLVRDISPIPTPSTPLLFGIGMLGLIGFIKQRKAL